MLLAFIICSRMTSSPSNTLCWRHESVESVRENQTSAGPTHPAGATLMLVFVTKTLPTQRSMQAMHTGWLLPLPFILPEITNPLRPAC
jgi:hypothetical protein